MATPVRRAWTRVGIGLVAAGALVPLLPSIGQAETMGQVQRQIAVAQHELSVLDTSIERATQRYDAAQITLSSAAAQASAAQTQATSADRRVAAMTSSMEAFATAAYQGASLNAFALLTQGGAQGFLDRASSLQALSSRETSLLATFRAAEENARQSTTAADQALTAQRKATAHLAADKAAILAAVNQERALLGQLQHQEQRIVAQAQAAALAARAAQARAAAERAAAAARAEAATLAAEAAATAAAQQRFAAQQLAATPPPPPTPAPAPSSSSGGSSGSSAAGSSSGASSNAAATAVQWAYQELGKPYQWGAAGPDSFDCSGLTQFVWGKAGVYLAHYTGSQWNEGTHVATPQPGDLVFFGTDHYHVGIYVGNGEMIDAPHTGAFVREEPLWSDYSGAVQPN